MERGPVALFGAIVAVGLGPALWLGAQFGRYDAVPVRSPVSVDQRQTGTTQLMGGTGAGDSQTGDNHSAVRSKPRPHTTPPTASPSHSPSATGTITSPTASPSGDPSTPASSGSASASPSQSTGPTDGDGGGQNSEPPSPPATGGGESGSGAGVVKIDGTGDSL